MAQHQYQQYQPNKIHHVGGEVHPNYVQYYPYSMHPPLDLNGKRVLRLAADLEHQTWYIQVNYIPTTYVTLIRMLSYPSIVYVSDGGVDWIIQQQKLDVSHSEAPTVYLASNPDSSPNCG